MKTLGASSCGIESCHLSSSSRSWLAAELQRRDLDENLFGHYIQSVLSMDVSAIEMDAVAMASEARALSARDRRPSSCRGYKVSDESILSRNPSRFSLDDGYKREMSARGLGCGNVERSLCESVSRRMIQRAFSKDKESVEKMYSPEGDLMTSQVFNDLIDSTSECRVSTQKTQTRKMLENMDVKDLNRTLPMSRQTSRGGEGSFNLLHNEQEDARICALKDDLRPNFNGENDVERFCRELSLKWKMDQCLKDVEQEKMHVSLPSSPSELESSTTDPWKLYNAAFPSLSVECDSLIPNVSEGRQWADVAQSVLPHHSSATCNKENSDPSSYDGGREFNINRRRKSQVRNSDSSTRDRRGSSLTSDRSGRHWSKRRWRRRLWYGPPGGYYVPYDVSGQRIEGVDSRDSFNDTYSTDAALNMIGCYAYPGGWTYFPTSGYRTDEMPRARSVEGVSCSDGRTNASASSDSFDEGLLQSGKENDENLRKVSRVFSYKDKFLLCDSDDEIESANVYRVAGGEKIISAASRSVIHSSVANSECNIEMNVGAEVENSKSICDSDVQDSNADSMSGSKVDIEYNEDIKLRCTDSAYAESLERSNIDLKCSSGNSKCEKCMQAGAASKYADCCISSSQCNKRVEEAEKELWSFTGSEEDLHASNVTLNVVSAVLDDLSPCDVNHHAEAETLGARCRLLIGGMNDVEVSKCSSSLITGLPEGLGSYSDADVFNSASLGFSNMIQSYPSALPNCSVFTSDSISHVTPNDRMPRARRSLIHSLSDDLESEPARKQLDVYNDRLDNNQNDNENRVQDVQSSSAEIGEEVHCCLQKLSLLEGTCDDLLKEESADPGACEHWDMLHNSTESKLLRDVLSCNSLSYDLGNSHLLPHSSDSEHGTATTFSLYRNSSALAGSNLNESQSNTVHSKSKDSEKQSNLDQTVSVLQSSAASADVDGTVGNFSYFQVPYDDFVHYLGNNSRRETNLCNLSGSSGPLGKDIESVDSENAAVPGMVSDPNITNELKGASDKFSCMDYNRNVATVSSNDVNYLEIRNEEMKQQCRNDIQRSPKLEMEGADMKNVHPNLSNNGYDTNISRCNRIANKGEDHMMQDTRELFKDTEETSEYDPLGGSHLLSLNGSQFLPFMSRTGIEMVDAVLLDTFDSQSRSCSSSEDLSSESYSSSEDETSAPQHLSSRRHSFPFSNRECQPSMPRGKKYCCCSDSELNNIYYRNEKFIKNNYMLHPLSVNVHMDCKDKYDKEVDGLSLSKLTNPEDDELSICYIEYSPRADHALGENLLIENSPRFGSCSRVRHNSGSGIRVITYSPVCQHAVASLSGFDYDERCISWVEKLLEEDERSIQTFQQPSNHDRNFTDEAELRDSFNCYSPRLSELLFPFNLTSPFDHFQYSMLQNVECSGVFYMMQGLLNPMSLGDMFPMNDADCTRLPLYSRESDQTVPHVRRRLLTTPRYEIPFGSNAFSPNQLTYKTRHCDNPSAVLGISPLRSIEGDPDRNCGLGLSQMYVNLELAESTASGIASNDICESNIAEDVALKVLENFGSSSANNSSIRSCNAESGHMPLNHLSSVNSVVGNISSESNVINRVTSTGNCYDAPSVSFPLPVNKDIRVITVSPSSLEMQVCDSESIQSSAGGLSSGSSRDCYWYHSEDGESDAPLSDVMSTSSNEDISSEGKNIGEECVNLNEIMADADCLDQEYFEAAEDLVGPQSDDDFGTVGCSGGAQQPDNETAQYRMPNLSESEASVAVMGQVASEPIMSCVSKNSSSSSLNNIKLAMSQRNACIAETKGLDCFSITIKDTMDVDDLCAQEQLDTAIDVSKLTRKISSASYDHRAENASCRMPDVHAIGNSNCSSDGDDLSHVMEEDPHSRLDKLMNCKSPEIIDNVQSDSLSPTEAQLVDTLLRLVDETNEPESLEESQLNDSGNHCTNIPPPRVIGPSLFVPSENTAFRSTIPRRLIHVTSEPLMVSVNDQTSLPRRRSIPLRLVYDYDPSLLQQVNFVTDIVDCGTENISSKLNMSPSRQFRPISSDEPCASVQEMIVPPLPKVRIVDCIEHGSLYQKFTLRDRCGRRVECGRGGTVFRPLFKVLTNDEKAVQTGEATPINQQFENEIMHNLDLAKKSLSCLVESDDDDTESEFYGRRIEISHKPKASHAVYAFDRTMSNDLPDYLEQRSALLSDALPHSYSEGLLNKQQDNTHYYSYGNYGAYGGSKANYGGNEAVYGESEAAYGGNEAAYSGNEAAYGGRDSFDCACDEELRRFVDEIVRDESDDISSFTERHQQRNFYSGFIQLDNFDQSCSRIGNEDQNQTRGLENKNWLDLESDGEEVLRRMEDTIGGSEADRTVYGSEYDQHLPMNMTTNLSASLDSKIVTTNMRAVVDSNIVNSIHENMLADSVTTQAITSKPDLESNENISAGNDYDIRIKSEICANSMGINMTSSYVDRCNVDVSTDVLRTVHGQPFIFIHEGYTLPMAEIEDCDALCAPHWLNAQNKNSQIQDENNVTCKSPELALSGTDLRSDSYDAISASQYVVKLDHSAANLLNHSSKQICLDGESSIVDFNLRDKCNEDCSSSFNQSGMKKSVPEVNNSEVDQGGVAVHFRSASDSIQAFHSINRTEKSQDLKNLLKRAVYSSELEAAWHSEASLPNSSALFAGGHEVLGSSVDALPDCQPVSSRSQIAMRAVDEMCGHKNSSRAPMHARQMSDDVVVMKLGYIDTTMVTSTLPLSSSMVTDVSTLSLTSSMLVDINATLRESSFHRRPPSHPSISVPPGWVDLPDPSFFSFVPPS